MGQEGFSSESALLYHRHLPTAVVAIEEWPDPAGELRPNHPLTPRHVRAHKIEVGPDDDAVCGRKLMFGNGDVRLSYCVASAASPLYRNGTGDELLYVEAGSGDRRDRVRVRWTSASATTWCCRPRPPTGSSLRRVSRCGCSSSRRAAMSGPRARYLSKRGQFLEHAPFCERDLRVPTRAADRRGRGRRGAGAHARRACRDSCTPTTRSTSSGGTAGSTRSPSTSPTSNRSPGGSTSRPRCTRPSPGRTSWSARSCRASSTTTLMAIPTPYNHANVDSDEVLFYVGGEFTADGGPGSGRGR